MVAVFRNESGQQSDSDDDDSTERSSTEFDGDSSYENASEESSQVAVENGLPMSPCQAAAVIQGMYRRMKARDFFVERVRQAYEKVYDEETNTYFYYNKLSGTSQWIVPKALLGRPLDPQEEWAARKVQNVIRRKHAWKQLLAMLNAVYEREYDPATDSWFYVNKVTQESRWDKPALFGETEPPTNTADAALFSKDQEIEDLKKALEKEKAEAEAVRKELEEKITAEKVRNGELNPDEAKGRSRHMDEWDVDTVVAWFHSLGFNKFDSSLREHQVDGLLLLHLMNEDWTYVGITSPLVIRRIDVAMQEYRLRFEHKQAGGGDDSDDCSNVSGSDTPSELLEDDDLYGDDDDSGVDDEEGLNDDEEESLGQDELAELREDEENITKEIVFEGEESRGRPSRGDIVRLHYICTLPEAAGGIVVENSRKNRRRPLEFVVGEGQVVRGIDRGVVTMLHGERAKLTVTAYYGYGDKGHPPIIPPRCPLVFDVNVLDFWPRPRWQKPLVQVLSEPYTEVPYAPRVKPTTEASAASSGLGRGGGASTETAVVDVVPYGRVRK